MAWSDRRRLSGGTRVDSPVWTPSERAFHHGAAPCSLTSYGYLDLVRTSSRTVSARQSNPPADLSENNPQSEARFLLTWSLPLSILVKRRSKTTQADGQGVALRATC